jgi:hypothetical protein
MNKIKILLTVALALLISGCGSKMPFKAQEPLASASLVYIYAIESYGDVESNAYQNYTIRVNDKRVGERIRGGEYIALDLKPTQVKLSATRAQIEEKPLTLDLKAGETYYLKITGNLEKGAFSFKHVSKEIGAKEITKTGVAGSMIDDIDNTLTELVSSNKSDTNPEVKQQSQTQIPVSKVEELEKAHKLKEKGIISEEEFKTLKSQIISK